jgi:heat shock protein HslJ
MAWRAARRTGRRAATLSGVLGATVALALGVAGCATAGQTSVSDPRLHGTWHLASASDHGVGIPLAGQAITLTIGDAEHTGGDSPCSSYSATVTGGVGVVYIQAQLNAGPRDDCATTELNNVEKNYLDALTSSRFARVERGSLLLTSAKSNLVFVRATPTPVVALRATNWRLYSLPSQATSPTESPALNPVYLRFGEGDGLTITSPCATFAANYHLDGDNLTVTAQHVIAGNPALCTTTERTLAAESAVLLDGPLLVDVSSAGHAEPATLVITNLNENEPVVWRATR